MFAKVFSVALSGLDGVFVEVETDVLSGLPGLNIVGLPDKAVEEAKERVRSALQNSGATLPSRRITVNLAPADLPKEGPSFDLPIALSLLLATEQIANVPKDSVFLGELSLDGSIRSVKGVLCATLYARDNGIKNIFVPSINADEAALVEGIAVFPIQSLSALALHLSGQKPIQPKAHIPYSNLLDEEKYEFDLADIKGQEFAKRALEIAAAGLHNIFFKGPPGAGKTMLARALPSILPALTFEEALEVTKIYSAAGILGNKAIIKTRPFRSPHHTTSHVGLIGGSANPKPGEITLAHHGVLFLDELPEFPRHVLEAMRQPMEDGFVVVSRAKDRVVFPSRFMLVAAANPCPCGFLGDATRSCSCSTSQILRYKKRVSGPILDRIDMHINVPAVKAEKIVSDKETPEDSRIMRKRVQKARERQLARFAGRGITSNRDMTARDIKEFCRISEEAQDIAKQALTRLSLSARSFHKLIKVSQTIADLEGRDIIEKHHVLEALQYRPRIEQ